MSALLFSSPPPPHPVVKIAKIVESPKAKENFEFEMDDDDDEDGLAELLEELDKENEIKNDGKDTNNIRNDIADTLDYFTSEDEVNFSSVDSLYPTNNKINKILPPMIDMTTPQIFSQMPATTSATKATIFIDEELVLKSSQLPLTFEKERRILLPETFEIEDLRFNLRSINESIHLNPIEAIKSSSQRRIPFPLGLMLRETRPLGSMAHLKLIDGCGNEISGTLPLSACTELKIKLHFGLIFILVDVSTFIPQSGSVYLNITKRNIQSFYFNSRTIE